MHKVLVYGWYFEGIQNSNLGDELFKESFKSLFPEISFQFSNTISPDLLKDTSAVFIGGGSFLDQDPKFSQEVLSILKSKKIFYVGVGAETNFNPIHKDLLQLATAIFIRTPEHLSKVKALNPNAYSIPDLVYHLPAEVRPRNNKSILVVPNISVVPTWKDPQWKHSAWNYFKSEFGQFLDHLSAHGFSISFFPMCLNKELSDVAASYELINFASNRQNCTLISHQPENIFDATKEFSQHYAVITQRFHGIILSEMVKTPYLALHHHDKLKDSSAKNGSYLPYYETSKKQLINSFDNINKNFSYSIDLSNFSLLRKVVLKSLG